MVMTRNHKEKEDDGGARTSTARLQGLHTLFGFSACSAKKHGKFGSAGTKPAMVRN